MVQYCIEINVITYACAQNNFATSCSLEVMANSTNSTRNSDSFTDNLALAAPILVVAVMILVFLLAVVVVLAYKRSRQARVRRLRESAQIAAQRLQMAIQLKQVHVLYLASFS